MSSAFPRKPIYPPLPDEIFIDDPPVRTPEALAEAARIRAHAERYVHGDRIPYLHAARLRGPFVTNPWAPPEARKEVAESGGGKRVMISDTPSKGTQTESVRSLRSSRRREDTAEPEPTPAPPRKPETRRKRREYTPEPEEEEGDSDDSHIEVSVRFRNSRRKAKGTPASEVSRRPTPRQRSTAMATEEPPPPSPQPPGEVDLTKEGTPTPSSPKRRKRKRVPLRPASPERHHNVPLKTQPAATARRHQTEPPVPVNNSLKENEKAVPARKRIRVDFDTLSPAVVDMKRGAGPVARGRIMDVKPVEMKPLETISPPAGRREVEVDEEVITLSQKPPTVSLAEAVREQSMGKDRKTATPVAAAEAPEGQVAEVLPERAPSSRTPSARAASARTPSARAPSERPPSATVPSAEAQAAPQTDSQMKAAEEIRNNAVLSFIQEHQPLTQPSEPPAQPIQPASAPAPAKESPHPAETDPPPATVPAQPKAASPPPKTPYQSTQSALLSAQRRFLEAMGDSPLDDDTPLAARTTTHHSADNSFTAPTPVPHPLRQSPQTSKPPSKPPSKTGGSIYSDSNITSSSDEEDDELRPSTRPSARHRNTRKPSRALNTYTQFTPFSRTTQVPLSPSPPQQPAAPRAPSPLPRPASPRIKSSPPPPPPRPHYTPSTLSQSRRPDLLPLTFDEPSRAPVTPAHPAVHVATTPFPPGSTTSLPLETPSFLRHPHGTTSTTVDSVRHTPGFTPVNADEPSFSRFLSPPRFDDDDVKRDEARELVREVAGFMEEPWSSVEAVAGRAGNRGGAKRERWEGVEETDEEAAAAEETTMSFLSSMGKGRGGA